MSYKFLPHTADLKIEIESENLESVFEEIVKAIVDFSTESKKIEHYEKKEINVEGNDLRSLIYNFIDEIIYLIEDGFIPQETKIKINKNKLTAKINGDKAINYHPINPPKSATYSEMKIFEDEEKWILIFVIDI